MNHPNRNLAIIAYVRHQHHSITDTAHHFHISRY